MPQQDINNVVFTARLTEDPELRSTPSGVSVANLRIAIARRPGKGGVDRGASYWDLRVWNGLAEVCAKYLAKGRSIAVEGYLEHEEWTAPDDRRRHRNFIVGEQVKFLDFAPQDDDAPNPDAEAQPETAEPVAA